MSASHPHLQLAIMPGPRNKPKRKLKVKKDRDPPRSVPQSHTAPEAEPSQCLTLEVDEETQCWRAAMQGYPTATRCDIHHGQFRILYRRYTDASKMVDKMNWDRQFPAHGQIMGHTDWRTAMRGGSVLKASKRMYALLFDAFSDLSSTPPQWTRDTGHASDSFNRKW